MKAVVNPSKGYAGTFWGPPQPSLFHACMSESPGEEDIVESKSVVPAPAALPDDFDPNAFTVLKLEDDSPHDLSLPTLHPHLARQLKAHQITGVRFICQHIFNVRFAPSFPCLLVRGFQKFAPLLSDFVGIRMRARRTVVASYRTSWDLEKPFKSFVRCMLSCLRARRTKTAA